MFSIKSDCDADKFGEKALEVAKENLKTRIEAVRCPVHNQTGKAVIEQSGTSISYKISGCCDALTAAVKKSLA